MPLIRSLASKGCAYIVITILLLGKIMPIYSCCAKKKLVYITITAPSSRQPSFYIKCTKSNMHLSCNIRLVSDVEYSYLIHLCSLRSLRLPYLICLRVSRSNIHYKT